MTRIVQQHPTLAAHSLSRLVLAVLVALLLGTNAADAALTTGACLVSKRKVWGNFRKCQVTAQVNQIKGKPAISQSARRRSRARSPRSPPKQRRP